jgi:hypothetical protein
MRHNELPGAVFVGTMQLVPGARPTTSDADAAGPVAKLQFGADLSPGGVLADASAPEPGRPNQLCIGTATSR